MIRALTLHPCPIQLSCVAILALLLSGVPPARAGVLSPLLKATGLDALLMPLAQSTGLALGDDAAALDAAVLALLGGERSAPLQLSAPQLRNLAAMDLSAEEFAALQAAQQSPAALLVTRHANDQPGLDPQAKLDPNYAGSQLQSGHPACSDGDGDGVCDTDDQCLKTPSHLRVMANGCHLSGPVSLRLEGVIFLPGSAELTSAAEFSLRQAAAFLASHPTVALIVAGHTDAQGAADYNRRLSQARALAVVEYLVSQNIARQRLRPRGYGESKPVADNHTEVGRARNRRVELQIVDVQRTDKERSYGN